jgi:hypothetical protein
MGEHRRNPVKHEYEVARPTGVAHIFVGNRERTAIINAVNLLTDSGWAGERYLRLYHTYPSPGPMRRYVGRITADGTLHRSRP